MSMTVVGGAITPLIGFATGLGSTLSYPIPDALIGITCNQTRTPVLRPRDAGTGCGYTPSLLSS